VARLQSKSFDAPDETRPAPRASLAVVHLDEVTVGHAVWHPGWRWSVDLRPIAGTASCQAHHLGYAMSGAIEVQTDSGESLVVRGGDVYEIPPGHDAWVVGDEPFVTVEWASARYVGLAPEGPGERVLATVLFTDIVDSTATLARLGDPAWRELLLEHNARMRVVISTFRGREMETTGDGFLAVFDGPTNAIRCGAEMARTARELGIRIRVGVHTGEVEFIADKIRGVTVHAAARVLAAAGPDQVVVTDTTRALAEGSGLAFEDAGRHALKGQSGERQLYRLAAS
jgi:class 3 adenylate cyclase